MNEEFTVDESLIGKFLAGEATPEEAMFVTAWIAESAENRTTFTQFEKAWELNGTNKYSPANKDLIWSSLVQTTKPQKRERYNFIPLLRLAAIFLLLITVGGVAYYLVDSSHPTEPKWITKNAEKQTTTVHLSETTIVVLNQNSSLSYPQQFNSHERFVKLRGEAFFDVEHKPDQPFLISIDDITIKVLGTAFNVQSLENPTRIETHVIRGSVMMQTDSNQLIVESGWIGRYDKQTHKLSLIKPLNENSLAYATHSFQFDDATLEEVTKNLEKVYGVTFIFQNEKIKSCTITSTYHNKSLDFILHVISESLNISCTLKDAVVYVSGEGCL